MRRLFISALAGLLTFGSMAPTWAENTAVHGKTTGKTVVAGLLSLVIWPGIGQHLNDNTKEKKWTHALIGIIPPFRLWSGWDALIGRTGGRWDGRI